MLIREHYGFRPIPPGNNSGYKENKTVAPDLVVGLELEIENFNGDAERHFDGVNFTSDGSLRSSEDGIGIEVITFPTKTKRIESLLTTFYDAYYISEDNFTERCSVHVHMNVLEMTYEQLSSFCLLYQTVESLLFSYAGKERENSVFCVPWNQCGIGFSIVDRLENFPVGGVNPFKTWQKYTALNLVPVNTQGSIEFRHLEGTCDVKRIMGWINLISRMYNHAIYNPLNQIKMEIVGMNTVSNYREWLDNVFKEEADLLRFPGFERVLSAGVVDSKLILMKDMNTYVFLRRNPPPPNPTIIEELNLSIQDIPPETERTPF